MSTMPFVVFATLSGDFCSMHAAKFWQYARDRNFRDNIVKVVKVKALTPQGALIQEQSYPVLVSAQSHGYLTQRGY